MLHVDAHDLEHIGCGAVDEDQVVRLNVPTKCDGMTQQESAHILRLAIAEPQPGLRNDRTV
jgi:hypothetical protein